MTPEKTEHLPSYVHRHTGQSTHRVKKLTGLTAFCTAALLGWQSLVYLTDDSPVHITQALSIEEREQLFLSVPNNARAEKTSELFSKHPHLAGSPQDFKDSKAMLELFQTEFGIPPPSEDPIYSAGSEKSRHSTLRLTSPLGGSNPSAWIDVYYPVLDTPLDRTLDIVGQDGQTVWSADLTEDGDPLDEDAAKYRDYIPAWHGLSGHGTAEGQLVYANYGRKADFDELLAAGVDFTGKIVIVRYGAIYRGLKVEGAQLVGAAGILIYSDLRDDGFVTVENGYAAYPSGPARNPTSVQRGSVMFLSSYPGDPTTPGYPAYEDAERTDATNIPRIPSLPISWHNAQRLLEEIGDSFSEQNKLTGKISNSTIRIVNHVDRKVTPIWNAMAAIPGHIRDEVVLVGCHRDAWVLGAADPISGTVALTEIIRSYGELLRSGWKPLRTIVFASWDAEEQGLVGSTEFGEDFADWISKHVVAYLNVDVSSAGSQWGVSGSPALAPLIKQTALDVPHPIIPGKTLWDAREDEGPFRNNSIAFTVDVDVLSRYESEQKAKKDLVTGVLPLGSGSDYTVFLQRLGVASTDQGFGPTPYDAVYHYHSIYDSVTYQKLYSDPDFNRHIAVAKHLGLLSLRITDSTIIPLNTTQYALELDVYLDVVENLVSEFAPHWALDVSALRSAITRLQFASAALDGEKEDAEKTFKELLGQLPHLPGPASVVAHKCGHRSAIYTKLTNWVKGVFGVPPLGTEMQIRWPTHEEVETTSAADLPKFPPIWEFFKAQRRVVKANKKLISFERGFISEEGIKGREWYKHLGVAPGKWLGYGATTFPGLTEAITLEKNITLAQYEIGRLVSLIDQLAEKIIPDA